MELQAQFKATLDMALNLLRVRRLHDNEMLVRDTVALVERAVRWGVYLEDDRTRLEDARSGLELLHTILENVMKQLKRELDHEEKRNVSR